MKTFIHYNRSVGLD